MAEAIMTYGVPGPKGNTGATGSRGPAGPTGPAGSIAISSFTVSVPAKTFKQFNVSPSQAPLIIIALERLYGTAIGYSSPATSTSLRGADGITIEIRYMTGSLLTFNNQSSSSIYGQAYVIS